MKKLAVMGMLVLALAALGGSGSVPGAEAKPVSGGGPGDGGGCQKCSFTLLPGAGILVAQCVNATWFGFTECEPATYPGSGSQYCDYGPRTSCMIMDGGGIFIP